jgi:hypothetical protein
MITTLDAIGTIAAVAANLAVLIGFPVYIYRARVRAVGTYVGAHRAGEEGSTLTRPPAPDTAEVRAARVRVARVAEDIWARAQRWDEGQRGTELAERWLGIDEQQPDAVELSTYEHSAGSAMYLDVTPGALARERRSDGFDRDRMISTGEMYALFGSAPVVVDEWAEPVAA